LLTPGDGGGRPGGKKPKRGGGVNRVAPITWKKKKGGKKRGPPFTGGDSEVILEKENIGRCRGWAKKKQHQTIFGVFVFVPVEGWAPRFSIFHGAGGGGPGGGGPEFFFRVG